MIVIPPTVPPAIAPTGSFLEFVRLVGVLLREEVCECEVEVDGEVVLDEGTPSSVLFYQEFHVIKRLKGFDVVHKKAMNKAHV